MKMTLLLSFLLSACFSIASAAEIEGKVTSYGIFKTSEKEQVVKSRVSPSGVARIPAGTPVLATATDRISAKLGVRFGLWYEIANVPVPDGEVEVATIAKHPSLTKPDGTTSSGFTFFEKQSVKDGKIVGWAGYVFDDAYKLATGEWEFELQYKGKTVCKQKFIVFKE